MNFFQFAQSSQNTESTNPFEKILGSPIQAIKINPPSIKVPEMVEKADENSSQMNPFLKGFQLVPNNTTYKNAELPSTLLNLKPNPNPINNSSSNMNINPSITPKKEKITAENVNEKLDEIEDYYRKIEIWAKEQSQKANDLTQEIAEYSLQIDGLYQEIQNFIDLNS